MKENSQEWREWQLRVALDAIDEAVPESGKVVREEMMRLVQEGREELRRALRSQPVQVAWTEHPSWRRPAARDVRPVRMEIRVEVEGGMLGWAQRLDPIEIMQARDPRHAVEKRLVDGFREVLASLRQSLGPTWRP